MAGAEANAFYSVGQANQKGLEGQHGNANTEIVYDDLNGTLRLNVYMPPKPEARACRRRQGEDWVSVPLEIPARYFHMLLNKLDAGEAYSVRVVRREGRYECLISFPLGDTASVDETAPMAGIDVNPDLVAVTVVLPDGNFKTSRVFPCPDLPYVSHRKREWIAGNLAQDVAGWLSELGITQVALEELSFAQDHDTNRLFNRITHNFCHRLLFTSLVTALRKRGMAVFTVSARFTSLIGYFKYSETYGLSVHQAAALCIARRALGYAERVPEDILKMLAPEEGCQHARVWGKLFGLFKAARKRAIREDRPFRRMTPRVWLAYMFAGTG